MKIKPYHINESERKTEIILKRFLDEYGYRVEHRVKMSEVIQVTGADKINEEEKLDASSGLRPLSPDGVPYIGRSSKCKNMTFATGHAMMGWSMATGTGKLVSEIISESRLSLDIAPFSPDRKF